MAQTAMTEVEKMPGNICFCKKRKLPKILLQISSSYAKILGETNFQPWEIPRSGSKAKDGGERRSKKVANNNGRLRIAMPPEVAQTKLPGQKVFYKSWFSVLLLLWPAIGRGSLDQP